MKTDLELTYRNVLLKEKLQSIGVETKELVSFIEENIESNWEILNATKIAIGEIEFLTKRIRLRKMEMFIHAIKEADKGLIQN